MERSRRFALALSSFALCLTGAFAAGDAADSKDKSIQSAFKSTLVRPEAKPNMTEIPVEWTYTNHWDSPLIIDRIEESCGCLKGEANDSIVEPGKTGHIRAVMTPGATRGKIVKSLHVRFGGHEEAVELVAEVSVPSSVELSKRELLWKSAEASSEQTIEVTSGTGVSFTITELLGVPDSHFKITQETLAPGKHYRLHITPVGSPQPGIDTLQVRTNSPDSRDQVIAVFLIIEKPAATPSKSQAAPAAAQIASP